MEKLIEICGLNKSYGKKQVLNNVDLTVENGQIIGLLGPNGSGKTTMLKIMTGLLKDYQGVVKLMEKALAQNPKQLFHICQMSLIF